MSNTLEEVEAHQIFELNNQLKERLDSLAKDKGGLSISIFERLNSLGQLLISRIVNSDAILIPNASLANTTTNLKNSINEINAYLSNKNEGHAHNAIARISDGLSSFPSTFRIDSEASYNSVLTDLAKRSEALGKQVETSLNERIRGLEELAQEIANLRQSVDREAQRISDGLGVVETQFTESQGSRTKAFTEALDGFSSSLREHLKEADKSLASFTVKKRGEFNEKTKVLLKKLGDLENDSKAKHLEILRLYDLVGRDSQIGGYKENADNAQEAGIVWDRVTFGFMVLAILVLVGPSLVTYAANGFTPIDWTQVLSRFPISTVLLIPAAYAGAQSRRQKKAYDTAKRNQLHIAALGPYLSTLPQNTQDRIKAFLAPRFFYADNSETLDIGALFEQTEKLASDTSK